MEQPLNKHETNMSDANSASESIHSTFSDDFLNDSAVAIVIANNLAEFD